MKLQLKASEIEDFRAVVERRLGLLWDPSKQEELAEVLRLRMSATNSADVESYLHRLGSSRPELRAIAVHLTVPETYFFRIPDHFRALTESVLPDRLRAGRAGRHLRILSAGCASGEEPYSIAMLLRGRADLAGWQVSIRGIDINSSMIAKGTAGLYSEWSLRETTAELRQRYFRQNRRQFQLNDSIREMVQLEESNLADASSTFWRTDAYDIIFFRNVMMYFSPDAAQAVIARVAASLADGGYLFLGPAETLRGVSPEFHLRHTHDAFYYQRRNRDGRRPRDTGQMARNGSLIHPGNESGQRPALADVEPISPVCGADWFDTIRLATERVEILARSPHPSRALLKKSLAGISSQRPAPAGFGDASVALDLLQRERFEEALRALPAGGDGQVNADVQLLRAVLLANSGDLAQAESACLILLKADELNAGAHYVMALCREHHGDRQTAMEHDRTAVYLDPTFAMPHLHLGLLARRGGELELARQELSQTLLLLQREDSSRILLFGGGFSREALVKLSRSELRACGGEV